MERIFSRVPLAEDDLLALEQLISLVEGEVAKPDGFHATLIQMRARQLELHRRSLSEILSASGAFMGGPGMPMPRTLQTGFSLMKQTGEWDRRMLGHLLWYEKALAAVAQPLPQSLEQMLLLNNEAMAEQRGELNAMLNQVLGGPNAYWFFLSECNLLGRLRSVQAAVALERWRLRTGSDRPPETLDVLVPAFLSQVPARPADGQPLHYLSAGGSYVISGATPVPVPGWFQGKRPRGAQEVLFEVER